MTSTLFFGGSIIAAFVAGMIALLAPCCISVLLPSYFASAFPHRGRRIAMTFLFAAGIATIILPLAMGASLLRSFLVSQHTLLYVTGGLLMLALAGYLLLGGQIHLPRLPGALFRRPTGTIGVAGVYTLGIFSGVASACCAPVLAGVIALSSVVASFWLALGLGVAYVFGMVLPLFLMALLWDGFGQRIRPLLRPRTFSLRLGGFSRTLSWTALASGGLLLLIGGGMIWVGVTTSSMAPLSGWQADLVVGLEWVGQRITTLLSALPNWGSALLLGLALFGLTWLALRQTKAATPPADAEANTQQTEPPSPVSSVLQPGAINQNEASDAAQKREQQRIPQVPSSSPPLASASSHIQKEKSYEE